MGDNVASRNETALEDQSLLQICLASTMEWKRAYSQIQQDNRHHLFMSVAGTTFQTLYDPGAMVSVMSEASYLSIPESSRSKCPRLPAGVGLQGAFAKPDTVDTALDKTFKIKAPIEVAGQQLVHELLVSPYLSSPVIMGMDLINKTGVSMDAIGNRLVFRGAATVTCRHHQDLAPGECAVIQVNLEEDSCVSSATLLIDQEEMAGQDHFIPPQLVRSVGRSRKAHIHVANVSTSDIQFRPGQRIARGTPMQGAQGKPLRKFVQEWESKQKPPVNLDKKEKSSEPLQPPLTESDKKLLMDQVEHGDSLSFKEQQELRRTILEHHSIFARHEYDLGSTKTITHNIVVKPGTAPVFQKQFPLSESHLDLVKEWVDKLLEAGVIRSSTSQWNSAVFCVKKPHSSGFRVVVDSRAINQVTEPQYATGLLVDEAIRGVARQKAKYFSSIDLLKAFHQVPLSEESKQLTAFSIPSYGRFEFSQGSPMGCQSSPAAFIILMSEVTRKLEHSFCYLDDIICASRTIEDHMRDLAELFSRLRLHRLKANLAKCKFFVTECTFLGFHLDQNGVRPGLEKTRVIEQAPPPENIKGIQSWLGLCNYFSSHVKGYRYKASVLSNLTKKDSGYKSGPLPPEAKQAWEWMKAQLISRPVLRYPDFSKTFHLSTDASSGSQEATGGLGAALTQYFQVDGKEKELPIGFAGRALRGSERNYSVFLLELTAACFGMEKYAPFLRGRHFKLYVDHRPLTGLTGVHAKTYNRLAEKTEDFDFEVIYKKGELNHGPDYVSRSFAHLPPEPVPLKRVIAIGPGMRARDPDVAHTFLDTFGYSDSDLLVMQRHDPSLNALFQSVARGIFPSDTELQSFVKTYAANSLLKSGVLFININLKRFGPQTQGRILLWTPPCIRKEIVDYAHTSFVGGHAGIDKTMDRLLTQYYWPSLMNDVTMYIHRCHVCQQLRRVHHTGPAPMIPLPQEDRPNQRVHLDLIGEIPGHPTYRYILMMTDAYSRYLELAKLRSKSAEEVGTAFFTKWCCRHGVPTTVLSDQGNEFVSAFSRKLHCLLGTEQHSTSGYRPECNGLSETNNRTVLRYLRAMIQDSIREWPDLLAPIMFHYNTAISKAHKATPFSLLYNHKPQYPRWDPEGITDMIYGTDSATDLALRLEEARKIAIEQGMSFRDAYTHRFNRDRTDPVYKVGQHVLLHHPVWASREQETTSSKLSRPWIGPCVIEQVYPEAHNVRIRFLHSRSRGRKNVQRVHYDRIKPYLSGVKSDVFGDPLLNPHATRGSEIDTERTPPPVADPSSNTENLVLEDSDSESVTEPLFVSDRESRGPEEPTPPPATRATLPEPRGPSPPPDSTPNDVETDTPSSDSAEKRRQPTDIERPSRKTSPSTDVQKHNQQRYNLRDRTNRRSWKDLYKRVKRSASKSLDRITGAGRKRS